MGSEIVGSSASSRPTSHGSILGTSLRSSCSTWPPSKSPTLYQSQIPRKTRLSSAKKKRTKRSGNRRSRALASRQTGSPRTLSQRSSAPLRRKKRQHQVQQRPQSMWFSPRKKMLKSLRKRRKRKRRIKRKRRKKSPKRVSILPPTSLRTWEKCQHGERQQRTFLKIQRRWQLWLQTSRWSAQRQMRTRASQRKTRRRRKKTKKKRKKTATKRVKRKR